MIEPKRKNQLATAMNKHIAGLPTIKVGVFGGAQRKPGKGKTNFEGGPARRQGKKTDKPIVDLARNLDKRYKWLSTPFNKLSTKQVKEYFDFIWTGDFRKAGAYLVKVVKDPIVTGKYGKNKSDTARAKGFNRLMIFTGTFVRAIKFKIVRGR